MSSLIALRPKNILARHQNMPSWQPAVEILDVCFRAFPTLFRGVAPYQPRNKKPPLLLLRAWDRWQNKEVRKTACSMFNFLQLYTHTHTLLAVRKIENQLNTLLFLFLSLSPICNLCDCDYFFLIVLSVSSCFFSHLEIFDFDCGCEINHLCKRQLFNHFDFLRGLFFFVSAKFSPRLCAF